MPGMEQGTMKRAFKEAGLTLHKQTVRIERGTRRIAYREERIFHQSGNISNSVYRDIGLGVTSAWRVVAGPNNTPYNIVFIDSPMMERLRKLAKAEPSNDTLIYEFIQKLDIGLCQIAFRGGKSVYASPYYDTDRRNKTLTLVNPNAGKHNHLARVAKKYKDFTPDREMRKILSKHNTEPRQRPAPRAPYMFLPPG